MALDHTVVYNVLFTAEAEAVFFRGGKLGNVRKLFNKKKKKEKPLKVTTIQERETK